MGALDLLDETNRNAAKVELLRDGVAHQTKVVVRHNIPLVTRLQLEQESWRSRMHLGNTMDTRNVMRNIDALLDAAPEAVQLARAQLLVPRIIQFNSVIH